VLSLLSEVPVAELAQLVTHALARGTDDPDAIALMLEQKRAPARHAQFAPQPCHRLRDTTPRSSI